MSKTAKLPTKPEASKGIGAKAATKETTKAAINKSVKEAVGKKMAAKAAPKIKIEVKEIPAIVPHGALKKEPETKTTEAPKLGNKSTAKLPTKPSGIMAKMDKIQSAIKVAARTAEARESVPEKPSVPDVTNTVPKVEVTTHLEPAMIRKAPAAKKPSTAAPGKLSMDDIVQAQAQQHPSVAPIFDVQKFLKK